MLQGQLVGRLVQHTPVQRQLHRVATVAADDLLGVPVEGQVDFLRLAQAPTLEVVRLWLQAIALHTHRTLFGEAGDHHRGLEVEVPRAVGIFHQAALGSAAHGQLLPVGGVAGRERLQFSGMEGQGKRGEGHEQGTTHRVS